MPHGDDPQARLRHLIRSRRAALRLSVNQAADIAGINRMTWSNAEKGTRATEDYNLAAMEMALRWAPGSIESILKGGDPVDIDSANDMSGVEAELRAIAENANRAPWLRQQARALLVQIRAIREADAEAARHERSNPA